MSIEQEEINCLKNILSTEYGVDGRKLRNKTKDELQALLALMQSALENAVQETKPENLNLDLNSLEPEDEGQQLQEMIADKVAVSPGSSAPVGSAEWNVYVQSLFEPGELKDNFPTVDGLRRLVQKLIGNIVGTEVQVVQGPNPENHFVATVIFSLQLRHYQDADNSDLFARSYSDVSDASLRNCEHPYNLHLSSTAATRAEGRILRKLLGLRTIAAEEQAPPDAKAEDLSEFTPGSFLNDSQVLLIDRLCRGLDINAATYLNSGSTQYKTLAQIPQATASKVIEHLHVLKKSPEKIAMALKGYDADWKNELLTV